MTIDDRITRADLTRQLCQAHDNAEAALRHDGSSGFDAIVWMSAHLLAAERVLGPAVRRHAPAAIGLLTDHVRSDRALHRSLRALEQIAAGDTFASQLDEAVVRHQVFLRMAAHAEREARIVSRMTAVIDAAAERRLADRYQHLLTHGATRPHPHTPSRGPFARLGYGFDHIRDHVLDVMDSRTTPLPRQRSAHVKPGRWGHYVLGTMHEH